MDDVVEKIIEADHELYLFLNNLGNSSWDPFWLFITHKWAAIPLYALLLYFIFKTYGVKGTLMSLVLVALLITCTDQLANVFKHGIQRPRPCRQEGVMEFARYIAERCGRFGYFSAHASSSFGLAIFVGSILKKNFKNLIWFLLFWAVVVSYSRIYVGVHYPLDIFTGMIIGIFLGYMFYLLHRHIIKKYSFIP